MKDIVDKLQDSLEYEFNLSFSERKQLLELINKKDKEIERLDNELQVQIEDNARLNEYIDEKDKEIKKLKLEENELMKTGLECCDKVRSKYKSRIDKAIEYIKRSSFLTISGRRQLNNTLIAEDLLNILEGEDNE